MTLHKLHTLTLPSNPRAVKLSRDWVRTALRSIDRDDLVTSAELSVSELVTNAIMHSSPPIAIRLRGTTESPRIEVADRSLVPPRPRPVEPDADVLLTFGRGLALVALYAATWGAEVDGDGRGKTVWFEPLAEANDEPVDGEVYDLAEVLQAGDVRVGPRQDGVRVRLLGTPVGGYLDLLRHLTELRRELRLLALANPGTLSLATEMSAAALLAEQERRGTTGLEAPLARAVQSGADHVDLDLVVPAGAPATMSRINQLLPEVVRFFGEEELLAPPPSPQQRALLDWLAQEYTAQAGGDPATAWAGGPVSDTTGRPSTKVS